ncbi:hypothetical protein IFM89_034990 [Coptis chinensis]|uniref:Zinc knuckle CX2CX4HX4C domain-containing protein n=1 Tax=Coptis chinensis TaxID=261450 RepID=A0A835IS61_9MAGN|nr:hypothetical protein IFM89_034990 [Coptis chinensis]
MSMKKWRKTGNGDEALSFDFVKFWVQIYGIPSYRINVENVLSVGSSLGKVKATDLTCSAEFKVPVARVRVKMDIKERLLKGIDLRTKVGEVFPMTFKYEKLDIFCYFCGLIGHDFYLCYQKEKYRVNILKCGGSPRDINHNFSIMLRATVFFDGLVYPNPTLVIISGRPQKSRFDQILARFKGGRVNRSWNGAGILATLPKGKHVLRDQGNVSVGSRSDGATYLWLQQIYLGKVQEMGPGSGCSRVSDNRGPLANTHLSGAPGSLVLSDVVMGSKEMDVVMQNGPVEGCGTMVIHRGLVAEGEMEREGNHDKATSSHSYPPLSNAISPFLFLNAPTRGKRFKVMASQGRHKRFKRSDGSLPEKRVVVFSKEVVVGEKRKMCSFQALEMAKNDEENWVHRSVRLMELKSKRARIEAQAMRERGEGHLLFPDDSVTTNISSDSMGMDSSFMGNSDEVRGEYGEEIHYEEHSFDASQQEDLIPESEDEEEEQSVDSVLPLAMANVGKSHLPGLAVLDNTIFAIGKFGKYFNPSFDHSLLSPLDVKLSSVPLMVPLPPKRVYKNNGYLMVSCNGGLKQMRATASG